MTETCLINRIQTSSNTCSITTILKSATSPASQHPNRDVEMQQSSNNAKKVTCDRNKRLNCRRKVAREEEEEEEEGEDKEAEVLDKRVKGVEGTVYFRTLRRLLP